MEKLSERHLCGRVHEAGVSQVGQAAEARFLGAPALIRVLVAAVGRVGRQAVAGVLHAADGHTQTFDSAVKATDAPVKAAAAAVRVDEQSNAATTQNMQREQNTINHSSDTKTQRDASLSARPDGHHAALRDDTCVSLITTHRDWTDTSPRVSEQNLSSSVRELKLNCKWTLSHDNDLNHAGTMLERLRQRN